MNCKVIDIDCENNNCKTLGVNRKTNLRITPNTFLTNYLYNKLPETKGKRTKVQTEDFVILEYHEYDMLTNNNYNVKQLKQMCKYYKQKVGGNKQQLNFLLYNYLKYSYFSVKIQSCFRGTLIRQLFRVKGPGFVSRKMCINDTDFLSLDEIKDISYEQFFSFQDEDNNVYGFDICSLYNLILNNGNRTQNPYNRKLLSDKTIMNARNCIRFSKLLGMKINVDVEDSTVEMSSKKKQEMKILDIFQKIDGLGNYSDAKWFTSLDRVRTIRFINELYDIWSYRSQISNETKMQIYPPNGRPFHNININTFNQQSFEQLKKLAVEIMDNLVSRGVNKDSKCLGAYYVLGALTIVNMNAAEALPWLYQSFGHYQ